MSFDELTKKLDKFDERYPLVSPILALIAFIVSLITLWIIL